VNEHVLRILAEEGVQATILAPGQAEEPVVTGPPYRWVHPDDDDRFVDIVFYDGPISHDLAFGLTGLSSQELVRRVSDAALDGHPDWNQAWRTPLRQALDLLRDHAIEVFERRGAAVLREPWTARDAYIDVILGRRTVDEFLDDHRGDGPDDVVALTLLETQRH